MALTVTSRGTGTHNTGATTLVPGGRTATLAVGSMGVLAIAVDNASSGGATVIAPTSWTDAQGNVWTRRINALYDNGAASAGIEMAWYTAPITVALLTTDLGTMTWIGGVSPVAKAWTWYEVIPSGSNTVDYNTGGSIAGATAANAQVTTASVAIGDAVIAGYFSENVAAVTGDSDSTNGTWTAQQTATIGTTTSGVRIATQQKVQTTTPSTQSYDVTVASQDRIAGYILLSEHGQKVGSDSGVGTDTASTVAAYASSESGVGADAATSGAVLTSSESGVGAEAALVDSGPQAKNGSESGIGTDTAALTAQPGSSESGIGSDAVARIGLQGADAGVGSDTASPPTAQLASTEAGAGSDLVSRIGLAGPGESAAGQETASLAAALSGSGESGTGSDLAALTVQAVASDSGVGTDSASVTIRVSSSESGVGSDLAGSPAVQVSGSESGVGEDLASVSQGGQPTGSESGVGSESASVSVQVTSTEAGVGVESASVTIAGTPISGSESGTATEGATVTVRLDATEAGVADDFSALLALLQGSDEAIAVELATVQLSGPRIRPGISASESRTAATTIADQGIKPGTYSEGSTLTGSSSDGPRATGQASDRANIAVGVNDG